MKNNDPFGSLIGNSPSLQSVVSMARRLGRSRATILLTGETGVGKEAFARCLHALREGREAPFVAVNCGAILATLAESELFGYEKGAFSGADPKGKPGKVELAQGGTLFLDEIGEMPLELQTKWLRILEEEEYYPVGGTKPKRADCRFVAATNKDLPQLVDKGLFREDLFYRLNVIALELPPLRERTEDIPLLAEAFLRRFGLTEPAGEELLRLLLNYPWPGNVRELRNAMERLSILSENGEPQLAHLPPELLKSAAGMKGNGISTIETNAIDTRAPEETLPLPPEGTLSDWLSECERRYIRSALLETNGNKQAAAQRLGITRMTLYKKLNDLKD